MFKPNSLYYSDGYKVGHKKMLAPNTAKLYGTWIPRSLKHANKGITKIVSFGQQLVVRWLHDEFTENFFKLPLEEAMKFGKDMSLYLMQEYNASHFESLHKLGYLPIRIKSLPEGIETNPNVPHMTFINTVNNFAWLTLYLETIISALAWRPSTSATTALRFRRNATEWVMKTDPTNAWLIDYMCHDFSARGMSPFDMLSSGLGHATSHRGSDTLIVIPAARYFYNEPEDKVCINSVNASEHSVSTTKIFTVGEQQMIADWLKEFDKGILSIVSDTFDLWKLITVYLVALKSEIMSRDGKLVIRPDSGDPVDITCGNPNGKTEAERKGVIELLWDIFGGTINEQGYKVLDSHVSSIYGDSITLDRQVRIYERLVAKGFASTNILVGCGSFQYGLVSRDNLGFAAKGAWFECDGKEYDIYKDPITDDGTKKSLKGLIQVTENYEVKTQCTHEEESKGMLQVIYEDGKFYNETTLEQIRERLKMAK
jgi:nicotinamide phosphoribosyltransferase